MVDLKKKVLLEFHYFWAYVIRKLVNYTYIYEIPKIFLLKKNIICGTVLKVTYLLTTASLKKKYYCNVTL